MAPVNSQRDGDGSGRSPLVDRFAKAPIVGKGMRVGLLGGSFDPPHDGHMHISLEAIKRLQLDQLWWLVSPGNPLKEQGPWPLERRLHQCLEMIDHPKIKITALEVGLGSPYTAQTLKYLTRRFASTRFVWLMGADNMVTVHHWRDWLHIFALVPVAVLDRPGQRTGVSSSMAAQLYRRNRISESLAAVLVSKKSTSLECFERAVEF